MRRGPLQSNETEEEVKQRQMKAELFKAQTKVNQINEKQNGWKKAFAEKKLVHKCSICMEFMSEPVKLPCGHYFCLDCLKMQQQMHSYSHMRECALCRKKFKVAEGPLRYNRETRSYTQKLVDFEVDHDHRMVLMNAMPLEFYDAFMPKLQEQIESAEAKIQSVQAKRDEIEKETEKIEQNKKDIAAEKETDASDEEPVQAEKKELVWTFF